MLKIIQNAQTDERTNHLVNQRTPRELEDWRKKYNKGAHRANKMRKPELRDICMTLGYACDWDTVDELRDTFAHSYADGDVNLRGEVLCL